MALGQVSQGGPHSSQGGPHENQGRVRRQAAQGGPAENDLVRGNANWTTCDYTIDPKFTCQDCTTRIICLPIGGKVVACNNVYSPYCNNGFCSPIPSVECAGA